MFNLPNIITLANLLFGCLAISAIGSGQAEMVWLWIALALVADFADGLVARWMKISSPIGKELDSLADVVSFGLVPAFMMYQMMCVSLYGDSAWTSIQFDWQASTAFIIALFSAMRLAKFNLDTRQTKGFIGVPTPTNCGVILGLYATMQTAFLGQTEYLNNYYVLLAITIFTSYMLLAELPMVSNKIDNLSIRENKDKLFLLTIFILSLVFFGMFGFVISYVFYILFSLYNYKFSTI